MQKYLPELLEEINKDPSLLQKMKGDSALTVLFQYAFEPEKKFLLPEGEPPYKQDAAPIGMSLAILRQELRRFYIFCRADLPKVRREDLFIQLLESVHPSEAKLLLAVKEQELDKLYKKITHEAVYNAGFISTPPPEKKPRATRAKKATGAAE